MQSIQISTLITDWSFKYCGASACLSKSSWLLFTHYIADWVTLVTIISSWADRNDITLCHIKPTVYRADVHRHKLTKTSKTANVWLFVVFFVFVFFPMVHYSLVSMCLWLQANVACFHLYDWVGVSAPQAVAAIFNPTAHLTGFSLPLSGLGV